MNLVVALIGFALALISAFMIYFARGVVKKRMAFGEENDAVLGMKITGWVILIISLGLIYFFI